MTPSRPPTRRTMRSSCSTSTVSPACTTDPTPARPDRREQRGPRAEVGPADVHRGHHDLAALRRAFHHRVVDRDRPLDRLVRALEHRRAADHRAERLEQAGVAAERGEDRPPPPQEDARVPGDALLARRSSSARARFGFSSKRGQRVGAQAVDVSPRLDVRDEVAVLGRRVGRSSMPSVTSGSSIPNAPRRELLGGGAGRPGRRVASSTVWSAGRTTMTSSSGRSIASAASAMAAAVLRPERLDDERRARHLVADEPLVAAVGDDRDVVGQAGAAGRPRRWRSDRSPSSGRNGFGRSGRLSGWRRVPPPPARITAYMRH